MRFPAAKRRFLPGGSWLPITLPHVTLSDPEKLDNNCPGNPGAGAGIDKCGFTSAG
jgi:hypothetical protein